MGLNLIFQDFDRAMLSGLKAAKALRKQGGGDVEQQVQEQPSQVRIKIALINCKKEQFCANQVGMHCFVFGVEFRNVF